MVPIWPPKILQYTFPIYSFQGAAVPEGQVAARIPEVQGAAVPAPQVPPTGAPEILDLISVALVPVGWFLFMLGWEKILCCDEIMGLEFWENVFTAQWGL